MNAIITDDIGSIVYARNTEDAGFQLPNRRSALLAFDHYFKSHRRTRSNTGVHRLYYKCNRGIYVFDNMKIQAKATNIYIFFCQIFR